MSSAIELNRLQSPAPTGSAVDLDGRYGRYADALESLPETLEPHQPSPATLASLPETPAPRQPLPATLASRRAAVVPTRLDLVRSAMRVKRVLDVLGATLGLVALVPVIVAITVAIKLDTRGTVLYRQQRVGRHGRRFHMLKFRTMVAGADAMKHTLRARNEAREGLFKIAEDPRVTRVGRWLRRSALDELPQLVNVLKGEMSLVGPRPLVVEEDVRIAGPHRRRLELTPGMTGPWQVLGPTRASLGEMAAIDCRYVAEWSLWTDLKILLRTVVHVVGRRGL